MEFEETLQIALDRTITKEEALFKETKGTGIIEGMNKKLGGDKGKNENRSISRYSTLYNATDISSACK